MKCPDSKELRAFAAGRLSGAAADAVADHLETCAACGEKAAETALDVAPPSPLPRVEAPAVSGAEWAAVWGKIQAALPAQAAAGRPASRADWGGPRLEPKDDPDATPIPLFGDRRGVQPLGDPDDFEEDYSETEIIEADFALRLVRGITRIAAVMLLAILAYAYVHSTAHAAERATPAWFENAAYATSPTGR